MGGVDYSWVSVLAELPQDERPVACYLDMEKWFGADWGMATDIGPVVYPAWMCGVTGRFLWSVGFDDHIQDIHEFVTHWVRLPDLPRYEPGARLSAAVDRINGISNRLSGSHYFIERHASGEFTVSRMLEAGDHRDERQVIAYRCEDCCSNVVDEIIETMNEFPPDRWWDHPDHECLECSFLLRNR